MSSNTVSDNDNSSPALDFARNACTYLTQATDPFHAVFYACERLKGAGFVDITDSSSNESTNQFVLQPGGKYYYVVHSTTLVAFCVGIDYQPDGTCGFHVVGGHTDSPNISIKPNSKKPTKCDVTQLAVQCYGGGLWHTWFDRDLSISGRVFVRNNDNNNMIEQHIIKINRPLLRISNLAIHLQSADERKAFTVNNEDHLSPILAMEIQKVLSTNGDNDQTTAKKIVDDAESIVSTITDDNKDGWKEYQEPALLHVLANELNCHTNNIIDFELNLYDVQKATRAGIYNDFIHSSRLDNLASCYMSLTALIEHIQENEDANESIDSHDVKMILLYDHEEVGSTSVVGAASPILNEAVDSITRTIFGNNDPTNNMYQKISDIKQSSFLISSDQAHAIHPNYSTKHEKNHQPKMNSGMVIKRNSNQRYATNPVGGVMMREIVKRATTTTTDNSPWKYYIPTLQEFMVRQDCGCGSTIGPTISANTGIKTIDMGCPQLSMHSIRETMGLYDLVHGINFFKAYYQYYRIVQNSMQ